jgi:hypothetical protein
VQKRDSQGSKSELRKQMDNMLKSDFVPQLRELGFKGTYPHFRRVELDRGDFLSFQFYKYGGRFCIHIGYWNSHEYAPSPDRSIGLDKLTAIELPHTNRLRVVPPFSIHWFGFKFSGGRVERCFRQVANRLPEMKRWWARRSN